MRHEYVETHERYYPRIGLTARPGDVVDFDGDPPGDGRWRPVKEPRAKKEATTSVTKSKE